jgi:hypothetical protein
VGQNEEEEGKREVAAHENGSDGRAGTQADVRDDEAINSR